MYILLYRDGQHAHLVMRPVILVNGHVLNRVHDLETADGAPEHTACQQSKSITPESCHEPGLKRKHWKQKQKLRMQQAGHVR